MEITLDVKPRTELGKGPASRYRVEGLVPAVFYGSSDEPVSLLVDAKQMSQALHTEAGGNVLININVEGKSRLTVAREIQRHPIRGTILHVDFVHVARDQKIEAHVPLHLVGDSRGVHEGGVLDQHMHEIHVEAKPTDVPTNVEIDITNLGIGDSLHVSDIVVPSGVEVLTPAEELVAAVVEPRVVTEEELTGIAPVPTDAEIAEAAAEESSKSSEGSQDS
ncbi:MAG TPA: 50S ribosomal protein L25 [Actinomycetota bacterium]|nr:50S ribosomal protein L25 [Actinomycetota bacterium]